MIIVGLTGGIGSGKTTVANMFKDLNVPIYDSDLEAKEIMNTSEVVKKSIIDLLGNRAYNEEGLNRAYVAERIFNNKELLEKINSLVHPAVKDHFFSWVKQQRAAYVIQESAIIFENDMQDRYDKIILVTAPKKVRLERVMKRDRIEIRKIEERMNNQLTDAQKIKKVHFVILNNELEETKNQVLIVHDNLLKIAQ